MLVFVFLLWIRVVFRLLFCLFGYVWYNEELYVKEQCI